MKLSFLNTLFVLFVSYQFIGNAFSLNVPKDVDPRLKPYIKNWNVENFIIHMNNHINNNILLFREVFDNYLANGIPADLINNKPAISGKELRKSLNIPEDVWKDKNLRIQLRNHISNFLDLHDAGKVDTSTKFLKKQSTYLKESESFTNKNGVRKKKKLIIEHLADDFGKNFNEVANSAEMKLKARKTVNLFNKVDDHVGRTFLSDNSKLPMALRGDWVKNLALEMEKIVDKTERWGNHVSPLEFGKKMVRGSEYTFKAGEAIKKGNINSNINVMRFHLEENYSNLTNHYTEVHKATKNFFESLKQIGIDHHTLDPIRKYELIPMVQKGKRSLNFPPLERIKEVIYLERIDEVKELIHPNKKIGKKILQQINKNRASMLSPSSNVRLPKAVKNNSLKIPQPKSAFKLKCFEASLLRNLIN